MIQEMTPELDRPQHLDSVATNGSVQEGQIADEKLFEQLKQAGWEITGNSAKNPGTGTQITLGDKLTDTQADEASASLGAPGSPGTTTPPAAGAPPAAGTPPASGPASSGGAPAAAPAAEAAPPSGKEASPDQKYSKGDVVDQGFLDNAKAAGWNVMGDTATAPDGTKYKMGEHMTFNQAREANQAGIAKPATAGAPAAVPA